MRALVIQNSPAEGPGRLGNLLYNDGFDVMVVDPRRGIPDEYDMVIILGGPESANDGLAHLEEERRLIMRCIRGMVPLLGVCLGSQLIASALGARVHAGVEREFGYYGDLRHYNDALFAGVPSPFAAFHWHGETFALPDGAVRLASSTLYENQAFRYGSAVGLQFHLEVDPGMVREWARLRGCAPSRDMEDVAGHADAVASNMDAFYANFKSVFGL